MHVHDLVGVGLGPFNLSLACLSSTVDEFDAVFFDQATGFNWHPGMMLESAHLQTPFMSDLVTLADPTHPLSFLNYAKQIGKLYSFYIRENFFLLRKEYNQYCQWAAKQLTNLRFSHRVERVEYLEQHDCYQLDVSHAGATSKVYARHLVLGSGPKPHMPDCANNHGIHSSDYLKRKSSLQNQDSITVVGSGQSAAEIFYDLLQDIDSHDYELNWVTRSARFSPLEYTKLTLEMTSPEYVDYFYSLPAAKRDRLLAEQRYLYKGINAELINDIFDLLYTKNLGYDLRCNILCNTELRSVDDNNDTLSLGLYQREQEQASTLKTNALVLATGFQYQTPDYLHPLKPHLRWDEKGRFDARRDYSVDQIGQRVFLQNAEINTHGFVTPDLGMACYRNSCILRAVLGYEPYKVEQRIGFQQFSATQLDAFPQSKQPLQRAV